MEIRQSEAVFAAENGRVIPKEDKTFGVSERAKAAIEKNGRENVYAGVVGSLLDDDGNLIVLSSVDAAIKSLTPLQYAEYGPIAGTASFKAAIEHAALGAYAPDGAKGDALSDRHIRVVATPGGTAALAAAVANYTCPGDKILTHDWSWANYRTIAMEQGRGYETFEMFDGNHLNISDLEYKVKKLLRLQDRLLLIINSPGNNPTGYSLSNDEWRNVVDLLNNVDQDKKVTLLLDVAYIDYAGDSDEVRSFLPLLGELSDNIMPMMAYSASKTFTIYGCRCAALIAISASEDTADEFVKVCSYTARAEWSNPPRGPQEAIAGIYADPEMLAEVDAERKVYRDMLLERGRAFGEAADAAGLTIIPYRGGFFISIPCDDAEAVCKKLEEQDIYLLPLKNGIRVSVAALPRDKCSSLPAKIAEAMR